METEKIRKRTKDVTGRQSDWLRLLFQHNTQTYVFLFFFPIAPVGYFSWGGVFGQLQPVVTQTAFFEWRLFRPVLSPSVPRCSRRRKWGWWTAYGLSSVTRRLQKTRQVTAGLELGTLSSPLPGATHSATVSPKYIHSVKANTDLPCGPHDTFRVTENNSN